jgi:hypothetical protein
MPQRFPMVPEWPALKSGLSPREDDLDRELALLVEDDWPRKGPTDGINRTLQKLDENGIKAVVGHEIIDALGGLGSQIAEQRRKAIRFYYGRPFGNEVEGQSKVVLTDVQDTIEWMMPELVRLFVGNDEIWEFDSTHPDYDDAALEATEVINHVFMHQCNGFQVLIDWFKTALLEKNGIVKPVWEERYEPKRETYRGMTQAQIEAVISDGSVQIVAFEENEGAKPVLDPETGESMPTYNITTIQVFSEGNLKVYGVPPEEFLIARRAIILDNYTPFTAHRQKRTVSDLIALGYPAELVANLPSDDTPEFSQGRTERLSEDETYPMTMADRADPASRELWVTDCYMRIDEDGDGYAELRNILVVGEHSVTIIDDIEVNDNPFCSITPNPMPHKFFGLSIADAVMDLQLIRSTLLRHGLDNIYATNHSRYGVIEDQVHIDDLLTSHPGGVVRMTNKDAVFELPVKPMPHHYADMIQFLEGVAEKRTGVSKWQQGPEANSMKNQTSDGISQVMQSAGQRISYVGQIFKNTGVKDLGSKLYRLFVENHSGPMAMKIRGEWQQVDPSRWPRNMNCTVKTGLSEAESSKKIGELQQVAGWQQTMIKEGMRDMVKPKHVYNTAKKITEAMGLRVSEHFTDPKDADWPKPQPSPEEQAKVAESEVKKLEHQRRVEEQRATAEHETMKLAVESSDQEELQKHRLRELAQKAILERERIAMTREVALIQANTQRDVALANRQPQGEA